MTKRILSVLLALVLVLGLSTVALAQDTFTLSITDEAADRTYEAYQVFDGDLSRNEKGEHVLSNIVWGSGVTPDAAGKINEKTAAEWEAALKDGSVTAKAFADMIAGYLSGTKATSTAGTGKYTFAGLDAGYYFVKETTVVGNDDAVSAYILNIVKDAEVATKRSDVPTLEKDQSEPDATYHVGEIITFTLTATIPEINYNEYDSYYFEFADEMSDGLTFVSEGKVTVNGEDSTAFTFTNNGQKLNWVCANTKADGVNIPANATIVVTYTAKLNNNAVSVDPENNTAKVIYTNNPENGGKGETTPTTELVHMIDLNGLKVDGADNTTTLEGAQFVLLNDKDEFYSVNASSKEVTWVATQDAAEIVTTEKDGKINFDGLDAGTYKLREIAAPEGYNKLADDITIVITATKNDDGSVSFNCSGTGVSYQDKAVTITVANNAGTVLPSTGGIGTTLFYVIGGLLMAFAVVLLVAKKRTVNE